ncbi:MAG TPA: diguanylate cyclase, partial [Candidatus Hydrogenedentes bacterium]|nr:diguanylate cyclase [Candidatus Hydrogenedentota bacterium]
IEGHSELAGRLQEHLERAGYAVLRAATGWDALRQSSSDRASLVVADLDAGLEDGSNFREKLLLDPNLRDTPFLFITAEGVSEWEIRGLRAGIDDYLVKPFDPVALVARVQAILERQRLYNAMLRVDPLTRLLNRQTLDELITVELQRLKRYDRIASLALLDLDDFASVNAQQGQAMGDLLLTCLAGIIADIRTVDTAGRFHGATFLLYLPETHLEGARTVIERIHERFRDVADVMTGLEVTFGAGLVESPRCGTEPATLFKRLEEALRSAKAGGRGRIVAWGQEG